MDQVEENRTGYCTLSLARNPQLSRHLAMTDGQLVKNSTPDSIYCPLYLTLGDDVLDYAVYPPTSTC